MIDNDHIDNLLFLHVFSLLRPLSGQSMQRDSHLLLMFLHVFRCFYIFIWQLAIVNIKPYLRNGQ